MTQNDFASLLGTIIQPRTIKGMSAAAGTKPTQTRDAVKAALPALLQALAGNTASQDGAQSLADALAAHDGSGLENILGTIRSGSTQADGAKILGHIFGGDARTAVNKVASTSGVSQSQASTILQTVAPLLLEALGKTKRAQGLDANGIAGVLSGVLSNQGGKSILVSLLDTDRDGDYKDDLFTMLINWIKRFFAGR